MKKFSFMMVSPVAMATFAFAQQKAPGAGSGSAAPAAKAPAAGSGGAEAPAAGSGAAAKAPAAGSGAAAGSAAPPKMEPPKPPTEIKDALYQHRIIGCRSHDRMRAASGTRLKQWKQARNFDRRMLGIV